MCKDDVTAPDFGPANYLGGWVPWILSNSKKEGGQKAVFMPKIFLTLSDTRGLDYPRCPKCDKDTEEVIFFFAGPEGLFFDHSIIDEGFLVIFRCASCKSFALDWHSV